MTWIKENWLAAVIAIGIVLSLAYIKVDGAQRDAHDRQATISGCGRTGAQKALAASGWLRAADSARENNDESLARYNEGLADGMILTIPSAQQYEGSRQLVAVELRKVAGRERYVLTPRATRLQHAGCIRAYGT